ncbi:hypothetical protein FPOAC2_08284 [Fusarium poae]
MLLATSLVMEGFYQPLMVTAKVENSVDTASRDLRLAIYPGGGRRSATMKPLLNRIAELFKQKEIQRPMTRCLAGDCHFRIAEGLCDDFIMRWLMMIMSGTDRGLTEED